MEFFPGEGSILRAVEGYPARLAELREVVLADAVMAAEIPSPTFREERLARFLCDRFAEAGLQNISTDEAGNATGILPGRDPKRNILVAAHIDKIWEDGVDHTATVGESAISGPGVADNSLGVAALASLPRLLDHLGVTLDAGLILLGSARSMGRGDLGGLRFFLDNSGLNIDSALCLEGIQLGRLSYSCLGMLRAEIQSHDGGEKDWAEPGTSGTIATLSRIVDRILAIERPEKPYTSILLGSINAGTGYNVAPETGTLRCEIRSEDSAVVDRIDRRLREIVEEANAVEQAQTTVTAVAHRTPGDIGFDHPFTRAARAVMQVLDVKPRVAPSISELSALLDKGIPSLTLGLTRGDHRHTFGERVEIAPLFTGLSQLVALLEAMDAFLNDE